MVRGLVHTSLVLVLVAAAALTMRPASADQAVAGQPGVAEGRITLPFSALQAWQQSRQEVILPHPIPEPRPRPAVGPFGLAQIAPGEAARGDEEGIPPAGGDHGIDSPNLGVTFGGYNQNNGWIPPDTMGAIGPQDTMEVLNNGVSITNRSGQQVGSLQDLTTFFASHTTGQNAFDPRVLYDAGVSRWVATADAVNFNTNQSSSILIGISATSDPTGKWTFWRINVDTTNATWADYPQLGINANWIVVSANIFAQSGNYKNAAIWALDKADFYSGGTGKFTRMNSDNYGFTMFPATTFDTAQTTEYLAEDWNGNPGSNLNGVLRLSTVTGAVGSEKLTLGVQYPEAAVTWDENAGGNVGPQQGSTQDVDLNDTRVLCSTLRNGSLWCAQTVFLPVSSGSRASVQWWEIDPAYTDQNAHAAVQAGLIDDPTGVTFYAYPSLAVNAANDMLIGFSQFSSSAYPSAGYAFRNATDDVNTVQTPRLIKAGTAAYSEVGGGNNRWGDYSNTMVDPVDDITMWTLQEYATTPSSTFATYWAEMPNTLENVTIFPTSAYGGHSSPIVTITLAGNAAAATVVNLTSADPTYASIPATVTVPAGSNTVTFPITTFPVAADEKIRILAQLNADSHHAYVHVKAPVLSAVMANPTSLTGGGKSQGTVNVTSYVATGSSVTINLVSNNSAVIVPATATVPAGARSVHFTITTTTVTSTQVATITASQQAAVGLLQYTVQVTVNP